MKLLPTAALATLTTTALAHGGVTSYIIDGKNYTAYDWTTPPTTQTALIQRTWHMNPLTNLTSPTLTCNTAGTSVPLSFHAPVPAGATIRASWRSVDTGFGWVHTLGPVLAYMASCGPDCTNITDTASLSWFKIAEEGLRPGYTVGQAEGWFQGDLWESRRADHWDVRVPSTLRPGRYMLRHEIVNLELDPAQFYPNCAHLEVVGEGRDVPGEEEMVRFPGGYGVGDPGVAMAGKIRGSGVMNYTVPGPKVWSGA